LITFDPSLSNSNITLDSEQLFIDADIYINANSVGGVTVDAASNSRVLYVREGESLAIHSLTVSGGSTSSEHGGGIRAYYDNTNLRVSNSTISKNYSGSFGGGIFFGGSDLLIENSTISDNAAMQDGGGIYNGNSSSQVTLINSTVSRNTAINDEAGGIWSYGGKVTLKNSTIANNVGADVSDQLYGYGSQLELINSIIANSKGLPDCYLSNGSAITSDSSSIIEDGSCSIDSAGGRTGDPGLETLSSNDGPTKTQALRSNSIARDTGDNSTCQAFDQRLKPRDDGNCDVGAFEFSEGDGNRGGFIVVPLAGGKAVVIPN
jgi:hypothetical protein